MTSDLTILSEALKDIDPRKLPHGIEQYQRFGPKTVRAIISVRDLIFHTPELSESIFRIGITQDFKNQEAMDRANGCIKFELIFESSNLDEARTVEADVRLNFLWHFPGRCLNKGDYRQDALTSNAPLFVYVACFPESTATVLGKV